MKAGVGNAFLFPCSIGELCVARLLGSYFFPRVANVFANFHCDWMKNLSSSAFRFASHGEIRLANINRIPVTC